MQTIKTELAINGINVVIGHQFLENIICEIPDTKENQEVFNILVKSDNPEVREEMARRCENLTKDTIHILINDTNQAVVDNVLTNRNLAKCISEEDIWKIIDTDNEKLLITIANSLDDYKKCDICKIVKKLANHKNASVRYSLFKFYVSDFVSNKVLRQLAKDEDYDVSQAALKELENRE